MRSHEKSFSHDNVKGALSEERFEGLGVFKRWGWGVQMAPFIWDKTRGEEEDLWVIILETRGSSLIRRGVSMINFKYYI